MADEVQSDPFLLIVAGGRDFNDTSLLVKELESLVNGELADYEVTLVSGMAKGADLMAYNYAVSHGYEVVCFPADWDNLGKRAGFVRNETMARAADGLIAFWDGQSRGTKHMIETMEAMGKDTRVIRY